MVDGGERDLRLEDLTLEERLAVKRQVTDALWTRGALRYKLHDTQLKLYAAINACPYPEYFLLCSRRLGKSYMLVCLAFEMALQRPGARVLYLAPFAKDAAEIAGDLATTILDDCPAAVRPEYKGQTKEFVFKNGSVVRLKGVNGDSAQYLRGGAADLVIVDEAGLMDDLTHVLSSIVAPMTMTTRGKVIVATTPPRSPSHDSTELYHRLADLGATSKFTLLDAPLIATDVKAQELLRAGEAVERIPGILLGTLRPETTTAKREFFCEFVTDADSAVVPEFNHAARSEIVKSAPRPPYFDTYVAMDPGFNDKTGMLFAYWDFAAGKLVIEGEALLHKASTFDIAKTMLDTEYALWGDKRPLLRVSDVDLRLAADLWERHAIQMQMAQKQDSLGAINLMRNMVQTRELSIDPRCVNLIRQLENATWNRKATDFERAGTESPDGHYDLVAALKYLCRHVNRHRNPYPEWYRNGRGMDGPNSFRSPRGAARRAAKQQGLLADTPIGRRLAKRGPTGGSD